MTVVMHGRGEGRGNERALLLCLTLYAIENIIIILETSQQDTRRIIIYFIKLYHKILLLIVSYRLSRWYADTS